jgi:hypothetical protein
MVEYYKGYSTKRIIDDNLARAAPYFPFQSINVNGDYQWKDSNKVLRLLEKQGGLFARAGGEALFNAQDGWSVQVILTVEQDDFFNSIGGYSTGFPAYKSRTMITLNGDNGDYCYLNSKTGSIKIQCDKGTLDKKMKIDKRTIDSYIDFKIVAVYTTVVDTEGEGYDTLRDETIKVDEGEDEVVIIDEEPVKAGGGGDLTVDPPKKEETDEPLTGIQFLWWVGGVIVIMAAFGWKM